MKKILKVLSVIIALSFALVLTGCGNKKPPKPVELTKAQIVDTFANFINAENLNFTANGSANYSISLRVDKGTKTTLSNDFEDITIKIDNSNFYISIPEVFEMINYQGWMFEKDMEENAYNVDYISEPYNSLTTLLGFKEEIFEILKENFLNLNNIFTNSVSTEKLTSGAYKLNKNINLTEKLQSLKEILTEHGDSELKTLINELLSLYDADLNLEAFIAYLKITINSNSTLQNVFTAIKDTTGLNLSSTYSSIASILKNAMAFDLPKLENNFFTSLEIESKAEFDDLLDDFIKLFSSKDLTLNNIFSLDIDNEIFDKIKDLYEALTTIDIPNFEIKTSMISNNNFTQLNNYSLDFNIEIEVENLTYEINFGTSLEFSNVGITEVTLPNFDNIDILNAFIDIYLDLEDLDEQQNFVIQNLYLANKDYNFILVNNDFENADIVFDKTNKTLTISKEVVEVLIMQDISLKFYDEENYITIYLQLNSI